MLLRLRSYAACSYPAGWAARRRTVGALPPEVLPKIEQLAILLQQGVNDGTISEGQIKPELNHGNLAGLVEDLNPEAKQLLDDINQYVFTSEPQRGNAQPAVRRSD